MGFSVNKRVERAAPPPSGGDGRQRFVKLAICITLGMCGTIYALSFRLHQQAVTDGRTSSMFYSSQAPSPQHVLARWASGSGAVSVNLQAVR